MKPLLTLSIAIAITLPHIAAQELVSEKVEQRNFYQRYFGPGGVAQRTQGDAPSNARELTIVSASYGFKDDRIEVADLLRPHVAHDVFLLRAPWGFGNPDPKPGTVKNVVIQYRLNGTEGTATFHQRQDIILPPAPKGLIILSAAYGVSNSRIDVTDAVRATVANGAIRLPANWGLGRVDPAAGKVKSVEITYLHDGALETATFSQHQKLEVP